MSLEKRMEAASKSRLNWLKEIKQLADKDKLTSAELVESMAAHSVTRVLHTVIKQHGIISRGDDKLHKWVSKLEPEQVEVHLVDWLRKYHTQLKQAAEARAEELKEERRRKREQKKLEKERAEGKQTKIKFAGGRKAQQAVSEVAPTPDAVDEIIKLAAIAAEYGIDDKRGFIKKMMEK